MSNTLWSPRLAKEAAPIYLAIADALERDVENGILVEGTRLPTHRDLASKLGLTPLTVTRAYKEAARRGLVDSTVGRGTFVRVAGVVSAQPRSESDLVDLSKNIVEGSPALDLDGRTALALRPFLRQAEYAPTEGLLRHRHAAAAWMRRARVETGAERVIITPGAQQAIVAILAALCRPGDTILAEEWTYPRFGAIAGLLNLKVEPVTLDEHGIVPAALEKACRRVKPKALYIVPNFQNPTGSVMPEKRRREIAAIARRYELPLIEDDVYGFLLASPPAPLASLAPELVAFVTSTSKSLTPSLRLGFASLPEFLVERVTSAFGSMTAFTSSIAAELFTQIAESGSADRVMEAKRQIVETNRRAAERALGGIEVAAHPMSPHLWIPLPRGVDARDVADRARMRGVNVAPASTFAIGRRSAADAVRVSIGATDDAVRLAGAVRVLASLILDQRLGTATVV